MPRLLCLLFVLSFGLPIFAADKPNVIFIDDMGYGEVGFNGSDRAQELVISEAATGAREVSDPYLLGVHTISFESTAAKKRFRINGNVASIRTIGGTPK